jgi:hypothetical protein
MCFLLKRGPTGSPPSITLSSAQSRSNKVPTAQSSYTRHTLPHPRRMLRPRGVRCPVEGYCGAFV